MPSCLSGCLLFFSCLAVCAAQKVGDSPVLTPGDPEVVLLTPGRETTLLLDSSGSEAEEIVLDAAVPDISYRITASDGREIRSASLGTFGWTAIPFLIPAAGKDSGNISIQLMTVNRAEGFTGIRVRVELRRIPLKALEENQRAAQAFNSAQVLHRSLRAEDLRKAIVQFNQGDSMWAGAGDRYGEALALGGKGESEIELSRYVDARRTLGRALVLAGKDAYLRGCLLHFVVRALLDQWLGRQAKGYAEEELQLAKEIDDRALFAMAQTDLAGVAFWLRDPGMSQIADQAGKEAVAAGSPETLAWDLYFDALEMSGTLGSPFRTSPRHLTTKATSIPHWRRFGNLTRCSGPQATPQSTTQI